MLNFDRIIEVDQVEKFSEGEMPRMKNLIEKVCSM